MGCPMTGQHQLLAQANLRHRADSRDFFAVLFDEPDDRIAVVLVLIDDGVHGSADALQFVFHVLSSFLLHDS